MCDIWKDNKNLKQLSVDDIKDLLSSLKKLGTQQVLMSGGEALLNPHFFQFCELLNQQQISVVLLSTGLTLSKNAERIASNIKELIISLDGDEETHNTIRNIPNAFQQLKEGIQSIRKINPLFRITGRTVIHRLNFQKWPQIIEAAKEIGLDQVSFLPADVSSHAFNREVLWSEQRQHEILPAITDLPELKEIINRIFQENKKDFESGFIAESPDKLMKIYSYYGACHLMNPYPYKKCNAPWVSVVVEADGTVKPCFFHASMGNIKDISLEKVINSKSNIQFRKELNTQTDSTCVKCVCYLHLSPGTQLR